MTDRAARGIVMACPQCPTPGACTRCQYGYDPRQDASSNRVQLVADLQSVIRTHPFGPDDATAAFGLANGILTYLEARPPDAIPNRVPPLDPHGLCHECHHGNPEPSDQHAEGCPRFTGRSTPNRVRALVVSDLIDNGFTREEAERAATILVRRQGDGGFSWRI